MWTGVELNRMGQNLELARYPIHWHLVGDAEGQYIKNASIHDTYNRCVTVHGTNDVHVENNVTYNIVGHCFFLEDGIEHGNEFVHNLAIQIKCHTTKPCVPTNLAASGESKSAYEDRKAVRQNGQQSKDVLIPSDNTVSAYWITNPDNTYVDNVAAGSDENGFWMSLPEHPNGAFEGLGHQQGHLAAQHAAPRVQGQRRPLELRRRSCSTGTSTANNTFGVTGNMHIAHENPADPQQQDRGNGLRGSHRLQEPQWRLLGPRRDAHVSGTSSRPTTPSAIRRRPAWPVVPALTTPIRHGCLIRCSWAKPRTSATPRLTRKRLTAAACRSP